MTESSARRRGAHSNAAVDDDAVDGAGLATLPPPPKISATAAAAQWARRAADAGSSDVDAPDVDAPDVDTPDAASESDTSAGSADNPGSAQTPDEDVDVPPRPPAPGGEPAVRLRGVSKAFGSAEAISEVDLTVPAGIFYGLIGPNGAGKTTTLSVIAGLMRPDRGSVRIGGVDALAHPRDARREIGVLPDRLRTFDRLTGRQLLHYCGVLRGLDAVAVRSRIRDLARVFDLEQALGRMVSDYSAGMTKKILLAAALIPSPRLLVLDEPFEAVDPASAAVILTVLREYVARGGTVVVSSHGVQQMERICARVAVMVSGQVLAEGSVPEVRGELSLEQRLWELTGGAEDAEGLEWLHTFSD